MLIENRQTLVMLMSGGMAGAAATLSSYPFDLLRTTLAAQGEPKANHDRFINSSTRNRSRCTQAWWMLLGVFIEDMG